MSTELILISSQYPILCYSFIFLIGILLGSFLNLVIYRLPIILERGFIHEIQVFLTEHTGKDPSLALPVQPTFNLCFPRSFCPHCKHQLTWWQNIPLFSYIILKCKCYYCQAAISPRYFLIELLTGIILLICGLQYGISWQAFWASIFSLFLIVLTFIDLDKQLLPNILTLPLLWLGLILSVSEMYISPQTAILGASMGYSCLWLIYWAFKLVTKKEGMGYGDFKLLAALGAWIGWQILPSILFLSAILGILYALVLRSFKKLEPGKPISFGPFLALAGWIAFMWAKPIEQFYFKLIGLY